MRILIAAIVLAAALWGGWWFVAARTAETAAKDWFQELAQAPGPQGLAGGYQDISVRGFPNRLDLTITNPELRATQPGLGWQAPFVQILALSYRPWHVILALPDTQTLRTANGEARLLSGSARASLVLRPTASAPVERLTALIEEATLAPEVGGSLRAAELRAALHRIESAPDIAEAGARYQIGLSATGLRGDDAVLRFIGAAAARLPLHVETLRLDATLDLTAPIALNPGPQTGAAAPKLRALDLRGAEIGWGSLELRLSGRLAPDAQGRAAGTLDLDIADWPAALGLARRAGLLRAEDARALEALLTGLAPPDHDGGRLSLPLRLSGGLIRLGPLVLGPAPAL